MRPQSIANLHAAKYDLRGCNGAHKEAYLQAYKDALNAAALEFGVTTVEIETVAAKDFGVWIRQERLPKLNPPPS